LWSRCRSTLPQSKEIKVEQSSDEFRGVFYPIFSIVEFFYSLVSH